MSAQCWRSVLVASALTCVPGVQASAQTARANLPPECRGLNAPTPEPWRVWDKTPVAVTAAVSPAVKANIVPGQKAAVTLAPAQTVRMVVTGPNTNPPPDAHGGMLSLHVPEDGIYWVSVSTGLWVDVVQGREILMQVNESPGPHCSDINKSLRYKLKAGDSSIQLSDNRGSRVDLLVVRQP